MMNRRGSVLLLTFIFMVALTVIVTSFVGMITINTRQVGAQRNNEAAFYIAEAGVQKAIWYLKNTAPDSSTDASWRTTAYPTAPGVGVNDPRQESFGSGAYIMWVENSGANILVTSRGEVNGVQRTVQREFSLTVVGGVPEIFSYGAYTGGSFNLVNGNNAVLNGDMRLGGNFNGSGMTINGDLDTNNPATFPTVDLPSYKSIADHVVVGNKSFANGSVSSGIWYVQGNITLGKSVTINGTLIATGTISGTNVQDLHITASSPYPAIIAMGDVTFNNFKDASIAGLVYVDGDFNAQNAKDGAFNGSLLVSGDIDMGNGKDITINYDADLVANPPPFFSGGSSGGGSGGTGGSITIAPIPNTWGEL